METHSLSAFIFYFTYLNVRLIQLPQTTTTTCINSRTMQPSSFKDMALEMLDFSYRKTNPFLLFYRTQFLQHTQVCYIIAFIPDPVRDGIVLTFNYSDLRVVYNTTFAETPCTICKTIWESQINCTLILYSQDCLSTAAVAQQRVKYYRRRRL